MRVINFFGTIAAVILVTAVGCNRAKPILPKRPLPPGTFQMQFTNKVAGPVELLINGTRIPVEQKRKRGKRLTISGLSQGTHRYFIASHIEVIGPDMGEIEIGPDTGVFQVHFSQRLRSTTYGAHRDSPTPASVPGLRAVLE